MSILIIKKLVEKAALAARRSLGSQLAKSKENGRFQMPII